MNQKYPKLARKEDCAFLERDACNYTDTEKRCQYMKYNNSKSILDPSRWECIFKKNAKDNTNTM